MLKENFKILSILLVVILTMFSCYSVFADNEKAVGAQTEDSSVTSDNFKKGDQYLTGTDIVIGSMIDGNVFAIGNKVTISTEIGGDAFILAKEVVVEETGYINGNLFVVSDNLTLHGLAHDVYSASKVTTVSGFIYRDLKAISDNLNIYGTIGRNATLATSNINFKDESNDVSNEGLISGDLKYYSPNEIVSNDSNNVSGTVSFSKQDNPVKTKEFIDYLFSLACSVIFVVLIWLLSLAFTSKFSKNTGKVLLSKPVPSVLLGILSIVLIPIIAIILLLLRVTATVGVLILAIYLLLLAISPAIFTISLSDIISNKLKADNTAKKLLYLAIVSVIIWLLELIPVVGAVIALISLIIGLGISITYLTSKNKEFPPKAKSTAK